MASGCVVLLSSGLDSTINLFKAHQDLGVRLAVTVDYGQKAAAQEIAHARLLCKHLGCDHKVLSLSWMKEVSTSSLTQEHRAVPLGDEVKINDYETSKRTAQSVWVPNRNGVLLNVAAAFAESLGAAFVVPGFNVEEAATFPDNSKEFLNAMDESLRFSTQGRVQTKCYTTDMNKTEIVRLGQSLEVPFELIWPCYQNEAQPCGQCESCQRFMHATQAAGVHIAIAGASAHQGPYEKSLD